MITNTGVQIEDADSAVSWKAIFAGATGSIAVTMILVAFGLGVGFTVISPWSGQGVSGTTFTVAAGVYLFVVAMLSSTIGGYLAAVCVRAGIPSTSMSVTSATPHTVLWSGPLPPS